MTKRRTPWHAVRRVALRAMACAAAALLILAAAPPPGAQDGAPLADDGAWDLERGFVELERLQTETAMLRGLAAAQAALLVWNRARAGSGVAPAALPARLCAEPGLAAWCRALPATFGTDPVKAADDRQAEEER